MTACKKWTIRAVAAFVAVLPAFTLEAEDFPDTVIETWAKFDPHAEPLGQELIRETVEGDIVTQHVRFVVGVFDGRKTRVAAFYSFPKGAKNLPGIVHVHGGGQRADKELTNYYAARGFAAISINWGEKVIGKPDDPKTDWQGIPAGFVDPEHHNEVDPAAGTIYSEIHPWNSSWLLYSAAARRAITFLEAQPECDGDRIGLQGHSMGGLLTVLTSIDPRVKAASPSVGGSGYLFTDIAGIPGSARRMEEGPARDLYLKTIDAKEYWPLIECPVMFLGATNDFNSPMEKVIRGFRSQPDVAKSRMSFTPHMNHRFTADNLAARIRWFDAHLKNSFVFPKTARASLALDTESGVPRFTVRPDLATAYRLAEVTIFYGFDRDPRARFWRAAEVERDRDVFTADCPVMDLGEPLFAFANLTYEIGDVLEMPRGTKDTSLLTLTSECRAAFPRQLKEAGVKPTITRERVIDDFARGLQDWSVVAGDNEQHWSYETHKINDPAFVGPKGSALAFDVTTTEAGATLAVIIETDRWRGYTGREPTQYIALAELEETGSQSITLSRKQFVSEDGEALPTYDFATSLILTPGEKARPTAVKEPWRGKVPSFSNLRWEGGTFEPRERPYVRLDDSEIDADALFHEEFNRSVDESVEREQLDSKMR